MDKQAFPILDDKQWTTPPNDIDGQHCDVLAERRSPNEMNRQHVPVATDSKFGQPISSVMTRNLCTIDAEDTVEAVQETLQGLGYASIPVLGSNGVIVGMIGSQELAHFHAENKNAKTVRAWEISRCTKFEVGPDASIEAVSTLMAENSIAYIAVTDFGILLGVVSAIDMLKEIANF